MDQIAQILHSRSELYRSMTAVSSSIEEEGGCGVTGLICSIPVTGKNIFEPCVRMHNRGNGKGGGIAAVGFIPETLGVSKQILENDYMLHIALLDIGIADELEYQYIRPFFTIDKSERLATLDDYRSLGLEVKPPEVMRYFVRVKDNILDNFIASHHLEPFARREAEDEFVYQNSYQINMHYYAAQGDKKAFVMSHGRNMMILKIVGYAENVVRYYRLDDFKAHVWLAHQRYPTRGRIWHPGGSHPFIALNEALVHNGDFANYQTIYEYLIQRNYHPLFLTDTEEAALLFDLWSRIYKYPLEYLIEAMAPTSERDFDMLPPEKQSIYRAIQNHHMQASPDGPWFFIIARNDVQNNQFQLIGITDTSMLRPQVFAIQEGELQVGLICSEKQAINATLASLTREDNRFWPIADKYWNARGGSYTNGGAFIFNLKDLPDGAKKQLSCIDKFGRPLQFETNQNICDIPKEPTGGSLTARTLATEIQGIITSFESDIAAQKIFTQVSHTLPALDPDGFRCIIEAISTQAINNPEYQPAAISALTLLNDRHYPTGNIKRSSILYALKVNIEKILDAVPLLPAKYESYYSRIDFSHRDLLSPPQFKDQILVIDAEQFESEGANCDAALMVEAYKLGWRQFIAYKCCGQRFSGCGFGPKTQDVRIDIYGAPGDYLASGIDGMQIYVHTDAQDQVGQIIKNGRLVIFGDTGQTFMYGAKGGEAYIMGNAAGRPLINAVGNPRVIINGTALDYLAESFMAGDPLNNGGFVIVNGVYFDSDGAIQEYESPYTGSNIFSLASGGAIYIRDPYRRLVKEQLNGADFADITDTDWKVILPYLEENERLFDIPVERLLTTGNQLAKPERIYRKIKPSRKL